MLWSKLYSRPHQSSVFLLYSLSLWSLQHCLTDILFLLSFINNVQMIYMKTEKKGNLKQSFFLALSHSSWPEQGSCKNFKNLPHPSHFFLYRRACEPGNQQTTTKTHQNEASKWPTENLNFIREYTDVFFILRASSSRYE